MSDRPKGLWWSIPANLHPVGTRCVQLEIPDDDEYEAIFRGALYELTRWYKYQRNDAHDGRTVAANWWVTFDSLSACPPADNGQGFDEDMTSLCESLRFQNGKLQALCCGDWVDIAGQGDLPLGGQQQPGVGGGTPAPGACQSYHAEFQANTMWLLPAIVNAGDTLTFTDSAGAANDGNILDGWRCPDGGIFFAGLNAGGKTHVSGDPSSTAYNMQIIALINGVYYPADTGSITVPGGVANAPVYLQVNDASLTDNQGSLSVTVELCNNAAGQWSSTLDFTINSWGFVEDHPPTGAVWMPGTGWQVTNNAAGSIFNSTVELVLTSCQITHLELTTITASFVSPASNLLRGGAGGTVLITPSVIAGSGANTTVYDNATGTTCTDLNFTLGGGGGSGLVTYTRLFVKGLGAKPPQLP